MKIKIDEWREIEKFMGSISFPTNGDLEWNCLMPVIEKIFRTEFGDGKVWVKYTHFMTFGMIDEDTGMIMVRFAEFGLHQAPTLIEVSFKAVMELLTWWNHLPSNQK